MVWYHPKYYAELRKRRREQQASSIKLQAASSKLPNNFSFVKFPETSVEGLY